MSINIYSPLSPLLCCPGGVLAGYMTGGSDGGSYCEPKKYISLKFYAQKNTWHQNFLPKKYKT